MLPIAILPVAGLLLGIGSSFTNETMLKAYGLWKLMGPGTIANGIFRVLSDAGNIVFTNLPIIFAMGVAIGMAKKEKEVKTNAMRILEKLKIPFEVKTYECDEFVDGMHIADQLGQPYEQSFKTLVMQGKSKEYYVFVLPVDKEVDLKKAAHVVGEKSLAMVHVKDIQAVTGYIRGGCTSIGMKKKYRTVIHESAREWDTVIVSGGRLGSQILLSPDDLVKAVDGEMADIVFCENK